MINSRTTYQFILLFVSLLFCGLTIYAQEKGLIQSKYYSTNDYNAGTQNWAVAQDSRGIMYFGNSDGVLEFDGETWRLIKVTNESSVRCLGVDINGVIYAGAFGELGFLKPNRAGSMEYHSLKSLINEKYSNFGEIWDVTCFSDSVFFLTDHYLFRYSNGKFDYWESENQRFYLSHKVNNSYFVQEMGKGLLEFQNNALSLSSKGEFFADIRIHTIFPMDNGLLICSRLDGIFIYDTSNSKTTIKPFSAVSTKAKKLNDFFIKYGFYHGIAINENLYALASVTGSILIVDRNWNIVDVINDKSIGVKSNTHFLYYQKNQQLWLALANGICQVEAMSPLRYWNESMGLSGVISDVARLKSYLYVSTGTGIFYTKCNQNNNFELNKFSPVEGTFEQSWGFTYFKSKTTINKKSFFGSCFKNCCHSADSILLAATSRGLFQIIEDKSTLISNYNGLYNVCQSKKDPSKLIVGLANGVAVLTHSNNGKWIDHGLQYNIEANIRSIAEDSLGNLWLGASYKGVYRVKNPYSFNFDSAKVELLDTLHGLPSVKSVRVFEGKNKLIFLCDQNYYTFNELKNRFDLYVEPNSTDSASVNKNQYVDSLSWRRIDVDIISSYYVVNQSDSVVWFSTNAGTFKHNGGTSRNYFDLFPVQIRKVVSGDSILYNGTNSKHTTEPSFALVNPSSIVDFNTQLDFNHNSLTFIYAWPFFEGDKPKYYSYKLDGYDQNWSDWSTETKSVYTNLREGKYSFKVKSKNVYEIESEAAEFKFTISPPWHRTYYAYFGFFIVSILFIAAVVKFYTYRLIKEKEKLEDIVKERTQEILMQNEEILVQAEHLKDANEWISAKNVDLEVQKKELERKKDQLEVSNATKNKFFRIIAHDLRNPISTLVGSTGYILTDIDDFDKEKTKKFVGELNRLSLTTYNLLENLLDWSSNQTGQIKYDPKPIDLVSIVRQNIELVQSKIGSKAIELKLNLPQEFLVFADENMIHTVFRNLLTNAVKFTNQGGEININLSSDDTTCSLKIADNGVGISKENIEKLFRIEKHLTTPGTDNERGSGLGLILSKEFIERNGGTISVESQLGKGSVFTITLNLVS